MREPFTIRISDAVDPERGNKFERVLEKRGANPTDVLRHLVDAYILSDGATGFPVKLEELPPVIKFRPQTEANGG